MNQSDHGNKKTLTSSQAADTYGLSRGSLANLRYQKKGPRYYRVGRKILYKVSDIEQWLFQNPVMTVDAHEDR